MEILISGKNGRELGHLNMAKRIDINIGNENKFQIDININRFDEDMHAKGNHIFVPGEEYGGQIRRYKINTEDGTLALIGDTWRGQLKKKIICPPEGSDYLTVNGEAHQIMSSIIGDCFAGSGDYATLKVSLNDSGFTVKNYSFARYIDIESGLSDMLKTVGARLQIEYVQGQTNGQGYVLLSAAPIIDYSNELEISQDNRINFTVDDDEGGINHLICLGKGELKDRMVRHLYAGKNGTISQQPYYTGSEMREAVYDYSNAESEDELLKAGEVRLRELMNYKTFKMTVSDIDAAIGDIIGGRERVTNTLVKNPIIEKILRIKGNSTTISYKLEGEE